MAENSFQKSLGTLLELSYKGYAEEQANLLVALDKLVTASGSFTEQDQYDQALNMMHGVRAKVKGSANQMVAKAYSSALKDEAINFETDGIINQSIGKSEAAMSRLMDQYKTSEMQDILASLHKVAGEYRENASSATMGKLQAQITRAHEIADLAEKFKEYDTEETVWREPAAKKSNQMVVKAYGSALKDEPYPLSMYHLSTTSEPEPEGHFTGEGIQLADSGMIKAYDKLSRLDLKGAQVAFDDSKKQYIDDTWADNGRALSSVISRANSAVGDHYGSDKDNYQVIPTEGLAKLDFILLDQTRENISNALVNFIADNEGIREGEGKLGQAYKNNGVQGLAAEIKKQMDAKSVKDAAFASLTDYAKIRKITGGVNLDDRWFDSEQSHNALAGLLESMFEVNKVEQSIEEVLNIDLF